MNFFAGFGKKRSMTGKRQGMSDLNILNRAVCYTEHLVLPAPDGKTAIKAVESDEQRAYLLFYAEDTEAGSMNAGYLAGQTISYLRFLGIESEIVRVMPEGVLDASPSGMRFAAALVTQESTQGRRTEQKKRQEVNSCVYTEARENWSDELLTFARNRYPKTFQRIRASRKESWIHFELKRSGRRHSAEEAFEAGIAAANIMSAAEELWVDLEMVKVSVPASEGYLFSVCRKGDRRISYA